MRVALLLCLLILSAPGQSASPQLPVLKASTSDSRDGVVQLSWALSDDLQIELQQTDADGSYQTIYRGSDSASVITGLSDGRYEFRARFYQPDIQPHSKGEWSSPLSVTVTHHPLSRAWGFFSLGAVVFLATAILVFHGGRSNTPGEQQT